MDKSNHFVPFLEVWDSSEKLPELIQSVLTQLLMMWNPINVSVHFKYQRTGFSHILFKAIKMEMTKVDVLIIYIDEPMNIFAVKQIDNHLYWFELLSVHLAGFCSNKHKKERKGNTCVINYQQILFQEQYIDSETLKNFFVRSKLSTWFNLMQNFLFICVCVCVVNEHYAGALSVCWRSAEVELSLQRDKIPAPKTSGSLFLNIK